MRPQNTHCLLPNRILDSKITLKITQKKKEQKTELKALICSKCVKKNLKIPNILQEELHTENNYSKSTWIIFDQTMPTVKSDELKTMEYYERRC